MIAAGELDQFITIEKGTETDADEYQDKAIAYAPILENIAARCRFLGGGERFIAEQLGQTTSLEITIRWRPHIVDLKYIRILWKDNLYEVEPPIVITGRNEEIIFNVHSFPERA